MFNDDGEINKAYVSNQQRIESKLDLIMQKEGIEWSGLVSPTLPIPTSYKRSSKLSWGVKIMKKLKSRKFIIAVVGAILIIANDGLDLGIESDTVLAFAGLLATWIVGESAIDLKRVEKPKLDDME